MAAAVLSVGPMPLPSSRYQSPSGSTPAFSQRRNSARLVPLSSPRDVNGARALAMAAKALAAVLALRTLAGSFAGPISTKSLYITSARPVACPFSIKRCSPLVSCTRRLSASPRRASSKACPVPTATTRTSMPLAFLNLGRIESNSPEFSVEVVEARMMYPSACALSDMPIAITLANSRFRVFFILFFLPCVGSVFRVTSYQSLEAELFHKLSGNKRLRLGGYGFAEEGVSRRVFAHFSPRQEQNVTGEPPGLM